MGRPRAVYVGPVEIAGQYSAIVDALRTQGTRCDLHLRFTHPFGYPTDDLHDGWTLRMHRKVIDYRESHDLPRFPHRILLEATRRMLWSAHAVGATLRYRTFVFAFATTFAPGGRDLPILRLLGKRVIVVAANGSEARPPYMDGSYAEASAEVIAKESRRKRRLLTRVERWADVVIGAPLSSSAFLAKPYVNYFAMGMPCRPVTAPDVPPRAGTTVRVLHAPSRRSGKGTEEIRAAVEGLLADGEPIEYVEISGLPNHEVLAQIAGCDVVVDQAYSDTPMATLAAEAAALGRPSVVGGYGWDVLRPWVPDGMWPPSEVCAPDDLRAAIKRLVDDPAYRERLGHQAQDFVTTRWSLEEVGERWQRVLDGDIPANWWVDPAQVTYTRGAAINEAAARSRVRAVVEQDGPAGLCLSHNPTAEAAFVAFAGEPDGPAPPGSRPGQGG